MEKGVREPESKLAPDTESASPLFLDFPLSELGEMNAYCLIYPVYGVLL